MLAHLASFAQQSGTAFALVLAILARVVAMLSPPGADVRSRSGFALRLLGLHLIVLVAAFGIDALHMAIAPGAVFAAVITGRVAIVVLGCLVMIDGLLGRIKRFPRVVSDVVTSVIAFIAIMHASSQLGVELSGVIATSAVLTAVVGLALQDTLGNALGGLALQLDSSIRVGDRIRLGDVAGRVSQIHWRYTAIETATWDTVIVPNSVVMRSQVTVIARRSGQPEMIRRTIYFAVDYRHAPGDVVQVIERALTAQRLPNVATSPAPSCFAVDLEGGQTRYAVRYMLTDLSADDTTDSLVRNFIFYALTRARIGLAVRAQSLTVTTDDQAREAQRLALEHDKRMSALRGIDLFAGLSGEELGELCEQLERAPFGKGETITREGDDARDLYMIITGSVSVRVGGREQWSEVGRLRAGDFFGEMALLAGEQRRATSIAITDVECYRLDADAFRALLGRRPDLAERVANVLAEREVGLVAARERLGAQQRAQLLAQKELALVSRIRAFFELT